MRSGTQDREQPPATGRKLYRKENRQEWLRVAPMNEETKHLLRNTAVCLRSLKGRLPANRRRATSEGGEQMRRSRRKDGQHTLKALHFLRRLCVAMPLSTRCLANSPPRWASVLSTSATFAQNLWTISQNSTDFAQNQWSFFATAQLGVKACAARGRSSALVRAIARAALARRAQQTVIPQFCTTKSENRDFSC